MNYNKLYPGRYTLAQEIESISGDERGAFDRVEVDRECGQAIRFCATRNESGLGYEICGPWDNPISENLNRGDKMASALWSNL
jgi:hypothetical protein